MPGDEDMCYFHCYHVIVTRVGLGSSHYSQGDRQVNTQVNRKQVWDGSNVEDRCLMGSLLGGGDVRVRWSMAGVEEWGRTFRVIWESTEMRGTSMAQALGVVWHGCDARADGGHVWE